MRRIAALALLLSLCAPAAQADEPETVGGHDAAWWGRQARAHERTVAALEQTRAACEEREAPPAYRNVPGQVFRGRDGPRYREVAKLRRGPRGAGGRAGSARRVRGARALARGPARRLRSDG